MIRQTKYKTLNLILILMTSAFLTNTSLADRGSYNLRYTGNPQRGFSNQSTQSTIVRPPSYFTNNPIPRTIIGPKGQATRNLDPREGRDFPIYRRRLNSNDQLSYNYKDYRIDHRKFLNRTDPYFGFNKYPERIYNYSYYPYKYYPHRYGFLGLGIWPRCNSARYYYYDSYPYDWYSTPTVPYLDDNTYNYIDRLNQTYQPTVQRPIPENETDTYFEKGVGAFQSGNYLEAAYNFQIAWQQAPEDKALLFTYIQALFADGNYFKAVEQLRLVLDKLSPEELGVLFPRGLYLSDESLLSQIKTLRDKAGQDTDLQLLAGYQLLGIQHLDEAAQFLNKTRQNKNNELAASKMLSLIEKMKTQNNSASDIIK